MSAEGSKLGGLVDDIADAVADRLASREPLLSPASLAERLNISERTARQMLADEVIPSFTVGGSRKIDPRAVEEYIRGRQAETS